MIVYAPSIAGGFVYDDGELILRNPSIRDLTAWRSIFGYEPARPLLTWTWALNHALGGDQPWSYHLVNVLLHGVNACLVAAFVLAVSSRGDVVVLSVLLGFGAGRRGSGLAARIVFVLSIVATASTRPLRLYVTVQSRASRPPSISTSSHFSAWPT